jgi:microcystin-dependent protein
MGQPFIGEIRMAGFNFAPQGWAFCDGSLLQISQNEALFNLIGTTYGGDGQTTFGLPNLQSRIPVHQGSGYVIGQMGGTETVTLTTGEIPAHSHPLKAQTAAGTQPGPAGGVWADSSLGQFSTGSAPATMAASSLQTSGGNHPHDNMPPFLAITFVISLFGVFPSQN